MWYKWFYSKPKNGDRIEITWLPMNNAKPNPNCYIGSKGTVIDMCDDGSFNLRYDDGSTLIVGQRYKYKKIND